MIFSYRFKPSSSSCVCYNPAIHQVLSHVLTCVSNCSVFLHTHHLCCHYPRLDFHHLSSGWLLQSPNQSAVFSVHSETAARMVCLKYKIEHSGPYLKHFDSSKLSSGLNPDSSQGSSWAGLNSSPHFYSQYFSVRLCGLIILKNFPSLKVAFCFSYLGFCLCRSLFLQQSCPIVKHTYDLTVLLLDLYAGIFHWGHKGLHMKVLSEVLFVVGSGKKFGGSL